MGNETLPQSVIDRCCVVSAGIGRWYPRGIDRMQKSLRDVRWKGKTLMYRDEYPEDCLPVETHGYAFKPYAMKMAIELGSRYLLWIDASVWAIGSIEPVFRCVMEEGYLFFDNRASAGEWCRDASLAKLELAREESFDIPEITSSLVGLDMEKRGSKEFLEKWTAYANDGETFLVQPRDNDKGLCSSHPRVKGHRYDQTAASVLVHRLGMKRKPFPGLYAYYQERGPATVLVNRGMS